MNKVNRLLTNILSADFTQSKSFYTTLFDFEIAFDSDWFLHLRSTTSGQELAFLDPKHDIVPRELADSHGAFYLTFVVEDVVKVNMIAKSEKYEILESPKDTFYGQRRMLLKAPEGTIVDVSSLMT